MTSIATISNAHSNYIVVIRILPVINQRIEFVDLMSSKKVGILWLGKSSKIVVFLFFFVQLEIISST